jgi:hypothetical protein
VAGNEAHVFLTSYSRSDACVHDGESYKLSVWRGADILTVLRAGLPGLRLLRAAAMRWRQWFFARSERLNER